MADDRDNFGEFGGKPGLIQTAADGHVELTAKEKALVGRVLGKLGSVGAQEAEVTKGVDAVTGEVWEDASQRRMVLDRQDAISRLNGRGPEDL